MEMRICVVSYHYIIQKIAYESNYNTKNTEICCNRTFDSHTIFTLTKFILIFTKVHLHAIVFILAFVER